MSRRVSYSWLLRYWGAEVETAGTGQPPVQCTRIHGTMCHTPQRPKQSLRLYPIKYCDPASSQIYLASQAFFLNIIEENYNMDPSLTLYPKNLLSDAGAACNMP